MAGDAAAGAAAGNDALAAAADWFWRWFKENASEHNEALTGAVHFLSDPEVSDGTVTFAVDLGTAPVWSRKAATCGCSAGAARVGGAAARSGRRAHRHPWRSMFIDAELCLPGAGGVPDFSLSRRLHFGPHAQKIGAIRRAPAYHSLESRLWTSTAGHCAT